MMLPPTKRINVRTRQQDSGTANKRRKTTVSISKRSETVRQKGPDSILRCCHQLNELMSGPDNKTLGLQTKEEKRPSQYPRDQRPSVRKDRTLHYGVATN